MSVREATQDARDAMRDDGIFDINGNIPFHPGYGGIHKLRDGRFVIRGGKYGTSEWIDTQREITDEDVIAKIRDHIAKSDEA